MASSVFLWPGNLTFSGSVTVGGTLLIADGTVGAPSLAFAADTDTGIYRNGANRLAVSAGGTQSLVITPNSVETNLTFAGDAFWRLGNSDLGTGSFISFAMPNAVSNFHVYKLGSGFTTSGQYVQNASLVEDDGAAGLFLSASHATGVLRFYTANTLRATIAETGVATFTGAVAIGNTVNSVSPTSPNRTVTISVGGVTLYLAAKTTND